MAGCGDRSNRVMKQRLSLSIPSVNLNSKPDNSEPSDYNIVSASPKSESASPRLRPPDLSPTMPTSALAVWGRDESVLSLYSAGESDTNSSGKEITAALGNTSSVGSLKGMKYLYGMNQDDLGNQSRRYSTFTEAFPEGTERVGEKLKELQTSTERQVHFNAPQEKRPFPKKLLEHIISLLHLLVTELDVIIVTLRLSFLSDIDSDSPYPWAVIEVFMDCVAMVSFILYVYSISDQPVRLLRFGTFFDVISVLPTGVVSWAAFKGNPYLRVNKILSLFTYKKRLDVVVEWMQLAFQLSPLVVRLASHTNIFITLLHFTSCLWYLVLKGSPDGQTVALITPQGSTSWLSGETTTLRLYCVGYDWAIKYMCGYGVIGPFPQTESQVLLMLSVALSGITMYAAFIGTVSTLVSDLAMNNVAARLRTKLDEVTDVLVDMKMPPSFQDETRRYYQQVFKMAGTVGNTSLLDDLPEDLLDRVNHQLAKGILSKVPMFERLTRCVEETDKNKNEKCINELMARLIPKIFLSGITIVKAGDLGCEMFFVQSGELVVMSSAGDIKNVLQPGAFYGEGALLNKVKRATSVTTTTSCLLFILSRDSFESVIASYPDLDLIVRKHAATKFANDYASSRADSTASEYVSDFDIDKSFNESTANRVISTAIDSGKGEDEALGDSALCKSLRSIKRFGRTVSEHLQTDDDLGSLGSFLFGQQMETKAPSTPFGRSATRDFDDEGSAASPCSISRSLRSVKSFRNSRSSQQSFYSTSRSSPSNSLSVAPNILLHPPPQKLSVNNASPRHSLENLLDTG